ALARHPFPALPGDRPPRVVRLYALAEDGTLVSLPQAGAAFAEGREFRRLAALPSFAANEFDFRFDFRDPAPQAYWSGLYLDLGGQGVVATLLVPFADPSGGPQGGPRRRPHIRPRLAPLRRRHRAADDRRRGPG